MDQTARADALRLLRAAKDIFLEQHGRSAELFREGADLDLVEAGNRIGLGVGLPRHNAAVQWLGDQDAIVEELTWNVVNVPAYRVTVHGVELAGP